MDGHDERYDGIEAMAQVLERLALTASKLEEIFQLLEELGRVEAMVARGGEQIAKETLTVTVFDSSAGGPDDR
jgi:hypothetical protein